MLSEDFEMNNEHATAILEMVNLFVQKERRARFIELFSKPKRYSDALWDLLHDPRYFDKKVIIEVPNTANTVELIYERLKKLGFKNNCFVFSCMSEFDGKFISTSKALEDICFNTDSMLFCPISKTGYYEGHEGWRYILKAQSDKIF